jgi:hypothetical protein
VGTAVRDAVPLRRRATTRTCVASEASNSTALNDSSPLASIVLQDMVALTNDRAASTVVGVPASRWEGGARRGLVPLRRRATARTCVASVASNSTALSLPMMSTSTRMMSSVNADVAAVGVLRASGGR